MVWVGILNEMIIGPYFFPTSRVNGAAYETMLEDFLLPELSRRSIDPYDVVYMHDGAPCHGTLRVRQLLRMNFHGFIGRGQGNFLDWPPRSPDLNPLDFFLWGFVKSMVFKHRTRTIREMKFKIEEALDNVTVDMLRNVQNHINKRYNRCVEMEGKIIEPSLK